MFKWYRKYNKAIQMAGLIAMFIAYTAMATFWILRVMLLLAVLYDEKREGKNSTDSPPIKQEKDEMLWTA
jgi:hypothetical protein